MAHLAENIVHFARVLRRAGLTVGPRQVLDAIRKKYGGSAIVYGAAQPEKEEDPLP